MNFFLQPLPTLQSMYRRGIITWEEFTHACWKRYAEGLSPKSAVEFILNHNPRLIF